VPDHTPRFQLSRAKSAQDFLRMRGLIKIQETAYYRYCIDEFQTYIIPLLSFGRNALKVFNSAAF
jgi:hypothetical protein